MDYAFQLYTARKLSDLASFLGELHTLGFNAVEGYEALYQDPEGLARMLGDADLSMPTGHFGLSLAEQPEKTLSIAKTLGINHIICPYLERSDRPRTEESWQEFADRLEKLARLYTHEGYAFSWHNHDYEFVARNGEPQPMRILLEKAPSLTWQCDLGWLVRAGEDPADWITQYGARIKSVHVKDLAAEEDRAMDDGWSAIGEGTLDWAALLPALQQNTMATSFVLEHDNPTNPRRFAESSMAYLKTLEEKADE